MPLEQFASQLGLSELQLALGVFGILFLIWVIVYNIRHAKKKDRKSTRLNSSHVSESRMPSSA